MKTMREGPSGSGIDNGTQVDLYKSTGERLVFTAGYHHMDDHGYYTGWTHHTIVVRPSLMLGMKISISGKNRNNIKEYLHDVYSSWLEQEIKERSQATSIPVSMED